jgi:hypothetical protein
MNMKKIFYFFITGAMFLGILNCANAQSNTSDKVAIQMLKKCYKAFNITCATVRGENLHKKLDSLQQKYCTVQLIKKIKSLGPDYDLLGYNPYTDVEHLNTLTVTKDNIAEDAYVVSYIEHTIEDSKPVDSKITIHVNVLEEADGLKIASIK